jgi:hypothetical protein
VIEPNGTDAQAWQRACEAHGVVWPKELEAA